MSEILVNTIKKADGTGGLTVPSGSGTVATLAGGTFTGDITMSSADLVVGSNSIFIGGTGSANELDDYEEGTWTPTIIGGTSGSSTFSDPVARYTKVGRLVHVSLEITSITKSTLSGVLRITGLPFAEPNVNNPTGVLRWNGISVSGGNTILAYIPKSANYIELQAFDGTGYVNGVSSGNVSSSYNLYAIDITYQIA